MGSIKLLTAAAPDGGNILLTVVTFLLGSTLLAGLFTTALGNAASGHGKIRVGGQVGPGRRT